MTCLTASALFLLTAVVSRWLDCDRLASRGFDDVVGRLQSFIGYDAVDFRQDVLESLLDVGSVES